MGPLKQREIRPCDACGKRLAAGGHGGRPSMQFFRLKAENHLLNGPAISRQAGLEQMLGSAAIAAVMGPDEDLSGVACESDLLVCQDCSMRHSLAMLLEMAAEREEDASQ